MARGRLPLSAGRPPRPPVLADHDPAFQWATQTQSMFQTGEPATGAHLAAALKRLVVEGSRALGTMPVHQFFTPQGDRWSPAEHARHLQMSAAALNVGLRLPAWLLRLRFGRPRRPSRSFIALRTDYLAALAGGGRAGRFTPPAEESPANPDWRRGQILTAWFQATLRTGSLLSRWREDQLDQAQLPHPLLGPLTIREMGCFTVYHTAHHLNLVMQRATAGS